MHEGITAEKVQPDYRMAGTAFTSGIANDNNPLWYHFDTGNYPGVWSGMLTLRQGVEGGYLSMPEWDVGLRVADKSLLLFDGQGLLHGVTPITKTSETGRRFTVVYYSLKGMWKCLPPKAELERIRRVRTEREEKRARRQS
jgi:hypothetical protein